LKKVLFNILCFAVALFIGLDAFAFNRLDYEASNRQESGYFKSNVDYMRNLLELMSSRLEHVNIRKKDMDKFIFAHRYASKLNIDKEMLIEVYEFIENDSSIDFDDGIILGATARIESRWNTLALSQDSYDIGLVQTRCKSVGSTVCKEPYSFRKAKYTEEELKKYDKVFSLQTQLGWFRNHINILKYHYRKIGGKFRTRFNSKYSDVDYKYMTLYPGYLVKRFSKVRQKRIDMIERYIKRYKKAELIFELGLQDDIKVELKEHFTHKKFTILRKLK